MRKALFPLVIFTFSVVQTACSGGRRNVFDCPVRMVIPEKECVLSGEEVVFEGEPVIQVVSMCVVDSLLVVEAIAGEGVGMLHLYDLKNSCYIGDFLKKGRGPGELLNPSSIAADGDGNVYMIDLSLFDSFKVNIGESIETGKTSLAKLCDMPGHTLKALLYKDSLQFIEYIKPDCMAGALVDPDGAIVKEIPLYPDVDAFMCFSQLSSGFAHFPNTGLVAMTMCVIPQVNFIDMDSGERFTVALNKDYRQWEKIIGRSSGNTMYYVDATASEDNLFALYYGAQTEDWMQNEYSAHLHVFDKEGNFLCDVALAERIIKTMAYDPEMNCIYGVDEEDRIYRYDLSDVI